MRYLGSKTLLVQQILELIGDYKSGDIFCDPFGGVGTVGSYMKKHGFRVVSGDLLHFAHFFQKSFIEMNEIPTDTGMVSAEIEELLNNITAEDGWLIQEYCQKRRFFTINNAKHIQGCIDTIWGWRKDQKITENEYSFLIASLIQSMDKVANTAGTYYAYLKKYYRKALKPFKFQLLSPVKGEYCGRCFIADANNLAKEHFSNVLYLDPPYNEREYSKYYHLPETIALGKIPLPSGKSGIPCRHENRSSYTIKSKAKDSFRDLVNNCNSEIILFHYADNGIINEDFIKDVLYGVGVVSEYYFHCKGYRTTQSDQNTKNRHHIYKVIL